MCCGLPLGPFHKLTHTFIPIIRPFCEEEFCNALFSMEADSTPGLEGFNRRFYQHFWNDCGLDIF